MSSKVCPNIKIRMNRFPLAFRMNLTEHKLRSLLGYSPCRQNINVENSFNVNCSSNLIRNHTVDRLKFMVLKIISLRNR